MRKIIVGVSALLLGSQVAFSAAVHNGVKDPEYVPTVDPVITTGGVSVVPGNFTVTSNAVVGGNLSFSGSLAGTIPLCILGSIAGTNQWDWSTLTMDCGTITQILARGTCATGGWYLAQYSLNEDSSVVRTGYTTKVTASGTFSTTGDLWTGIAVITNGNIGWLILNGDGGYPTNVMHWRGRGYQTITF